MWSSAFVCWGPNNREAGVIVPSARRADREGTIRVEFKPADNTANPYLALLGLLAAGMDGIECGLDPGDLGGSRRCAGERRRPPGSDGRGVVRVLRQGEAQRVGDVRRRERRAFNRIPRAGLLSGLIDSATYSRITSCFAGVVVACRTRRLRACQEARPRYGDCYHRLRGDTE